MGHLPHAHLNIPNEQTNYINMKPLLCENAITYNNNNNPKTF